MGKRSEGIEERSAEEMSVLVKCHPDFGVGISSSP